METSINRQEIINELKSNLETANKLRQEYKSLQSIYQCDSKQRTALWFGLPIDTYYNYAYSEWREASKRLEQFLEQMRRHRIAFEEWAGYNASSMPYTKWKDDFIMFCDSQNIETVKPYIQ